MYHIPSLAPRITYIIGGILFSLLLIASRLFYLQIYWTEHYNKRGEKNFLRFESIHSPRGNILDRNGKLLATNRPMPMLYWQGSGNKQLSNDQILVLQQIQDITNIPIVNDVLFNRISYAEKQYRSLLIANDISFDTLSKIEEIFPHNKNLMVQTHFIRHYPYETCASHILGYLGRQIDAQPLGQMGLEKLCEELLRGEEGTMARTINSVGRDITNVNVKAACEGNDIHTTLDLGIQKICEEIFEQDQVGTMIVMDPEHGDILGMVSRPAFDPELFLKPISKELWQELQEKKPFLNRALNAYPPGSIFKLISVSAALEHGIVTPTQTWNCRGFVNFAERRYWCHRRWGHNELDTVQAVAQSCNILFYEIGKKIDIDLIAEYAYKFGLGSPTGFLFPERSGIVPSRAWKMQERGERWWPGETLSVSIGQSFLLATPLQIVRMISAIFTGELVKPRMLISETIEKKPLLIKPATINCLKESMRFVVTHGTGKRVNSVKDIEIYAKTSTAQTSGMHNHELGQAFLPHAWFVGYFSYKELKPLSFLILVENAGTSQVATTIAKKFLIRYKDLMHQ